MSQITYNYPGMLGTAAEMNAQAAALTAMGGNVESEQAALGASWVGDTGISVQQTLFDGGDLVLSRPDQHVAWRGNAAPAEPLSLIDHVRGAANWVRGEGSPADA